MIIIFFKGFYVLTHSASTLCSNNNLFCLHGTLNTYKHTNFFLIILFVLTTKFDHIKMEGFVVDTKYPLNNIAGRAF